MQKIILVGNPNTGKTTLFNTLTGQSERVGNWHGVTVDIKEHSLRNSNEIIIVDLPGLYSLDGYSPEEKISAKYIDEHKNNLIVNVCDACNLKRNFKLTQQLLDRGANVVLAINNTGKTQNLEKVVEKLKKQFSVEVFIIDARKCKNCKDLINYIHKAKQNNTKLQILNKDNSNSMHSLSDVLNECSYKTDGEKKQIIDKLLLSKWLSIPIFIFAFMAVFFITFGSVGSYLSELIGNAYANVVDCLFPAIQNNTSNWFVSFLKNGVFAGVGAVIAFLPQITLIFMFMNILDDSGYLSRVAFMFDGVLSKIGLSGKGVLSLLTGFGCTTSAILVTRNIENECVRKNTAMVLPDFSCSAKLPIFMLFCSVFFKMLGFFAVFCIYAIGVLIGLFVAIILAKFGKDKVCQQFIMEMPKMHFPNVHNVFKRTLYHAKDFLVRVGSMIFVMNIVVWLLSHFSFTLRFLPSDINASIIGVLSNVVLPAFKPLGFAKPAIIMALMAGLVAKEMVITSLMLAGGASTLSELSGLLISSDSVVGLSKAGACAFIVFVLLYPACISAFAMMSKEFGRKFAISSAVFQLSIAYIFAVVAFSFISGHILFAIMFTLLLVAIMLGFMIKLRKPMCKEKCYACEGKCL
ncbi:MAG: ferrous iron transporter B [Clostridia bacterium]|nr:ferrous iron transporter B [Clostridia bacterium]